MKNELTIAIVSISIILGLAFFIFNLEQTGITNFAVYNSSSITNGNTNQNSEKNINVTIEVASQAINDSEEIIQELKNSNLSVVYMNDLLIEAKKLFDAADYSGVLNYTEQIKQRRETAFQIYDTLAITKMSIEKYGKKGINMNQSRDLLEKARTAFYEDRYQEAEDLIKQTRNSIDSIVSEISVLGDLKKNAVNFFQRSWYYLLAILFVLAIIVYFTYKQVELNLLKDKIKRMKTEKIALDRLMRKTQAERYKENKISGLTYNLRMKKYQEKLAGIEEELPTLEERLKRFKTNKKTD
jgi:hypothetical protein